MFLPLGIQFTRPNDGVDIVKKKGFSQISSFACPPSRYKVILSKIALCQRWFFKSEMFSALPTPSVLFLTKFL